MGFWGWLVVALIGVAVLAMMLLSTRGRRLRLWCPEQEMVADVEVDEDAYATDLGDRRVLFCSLLDPSRRSYCDRTCLTRFLRRHR